MTTRSILKEIFDPELTDNYEDEDVVKFISAAGPLDRSEDVTDLTDIMNCPAKRKEFMTIHEIDPLCQRPLELCVKLGLFPTYSCEGHEHDEYSAYFLFDNSETDTAEKIFQFISYNLWKFISNPHALTIDKSMRNPDIFSTPISRYTKNWRLATTIRYYAGDNISQLRFWRSLTAILEYLLNEKNDGPRTPAVRIKREGDEVVIGDDRIPMGTPLFYEYLFVSLMDNGITTFKINDPELSTIFINCGLFGPRVSDIPDSLEFSIFTHFPMHRIIGN